MIVVVNVPGHSGGLRRELGPPLVVHAARRFVGRQAVAQVRAQRLAQHQRERQRGQQRDDEHARQNDRRLVHPANAVNKSPLSPEPRALSHVHTKNAHVSS